VRARGRAWLSALARDRRGLSTLEFALILPLMLVLTFSAVEMINYVLVRQQISQLALQVVDNATRIGTQNTIQTQIDEKQINDLFTGADLQGANLDMAKNGRIILSSLETLDGKPNRQYIHWQRCYGALKYASTYGLEGDGKDNSSFKGMGPAGGQVTALDGVPAMFVEIAYQYQPLIWSYFGTNQIIQENASMLVRDNRDTSGDGVNPVKGVMKSAC
jgi:hypothetical protein